MTRVKFATLLMVLIVGGTSVGSVAGFYLTTFWFAGWEPFVYPCPYSDKSGMCAADLNQTDPEASVWYYSWPSINPSHIHFQPKRACVLDFLYHDPFPEGTLRWEYK